MESMRFDFNNMLGAHIGDGHGVTPSELDAMQKDIQAAHEHLTSVIANPSSRVAVGLEWTQLPLQSKAVIREIKELADVVARKYENVVFLGIGGSYLGLKAAQDALCVPYYNEFSLVRKKRPRVYFEGNNLDPDTLHSMLHNLNPRKTFVCVISKSGETTETKAAFVIVEAWLKKHVGAKYGRQICAITDPESGSLRQKVIKAQGDDSSSFRDFPLLKGVGGRFSEFNMGLFHCAVTGVHIEDVFEGARAMARRCSEPRLSKNPAYMYAALHTILSRRKSKDIAILMPFAETLRSTADWYVQLLAESLGKKYGRLIEKAQDSSERWLQDKGNVVNTGRTPISSRGTNDLHSIQQNNIEGANNKVVTFIRVDTFRNDMRLPAGNGVLSGKRFSELMKLAQEATEWALLQESRPNCTIVMPEISAYHWGALLFFFEMATAFEGELLGVNAFDQPGVEGYKNYMYYKLGKEDIPQGIIEQIKSRPLVKDPAYIL